MQAFAVLFALACLACASAGLDLYGGLGYGYGGLGGLGELGGTGVLGGDGCTASCVRSYVYTGHCDSGCGGCGNYLTGVCSTTCVQQYVSTGHCGSGCGSCGSILGGYLGGVGLGGYGRGLQGGYNYGYPGSGLGYGYPGLGLGYSTQGYAGGAAVAGQAISSSTNRQKKKNTGEWEQTIKTRVKKTVECEWECVHNETCKKQWSAFHTYYGQCSQCSAC